MTETVWAGKYLEVKREGPWEYVARVSDTGAVVIVAVDADDQLILIEQERVPIGRRSLEVPAGLVGDDTEGESIEAAAARELEEETGYRAERIDRIGEFFSSPGMTSERFTLVRARGLTRVGDGGGTSQEDITVYRVPLTQVTQFVAEKRASGVGIDAKLLLLLGAGMF